MEFAIAAIGQDRPGIVSAVAGALEGAGASIEDSSMSILGGQFAILLLVGAPDEARVRSALEPVAAELELTLQIAHTGTPVATDEHAAYTVSAYGADRPGLVARLARTLADARANIHDFGSRLTDAGLFTMWFNVAMPPDADVDGLEDALNGAAGDDLTVNVHAVDDEAL